MSYVVERKQCPKCMDSGQDNLAVYDDGHSHCYACSLTVGGIKVEQSLLSEAELLPMFTTLDILGKRGIREEIIKQYEVSTIQHEDGSIQVAFPLHDINGNQYTEHFRAVDLTTGCLTRDMRYRRGTKIKLPLFGWQLVKKQQTIVITEGETDALILASALFGRNDVAVIGLVGVSNAQRLASHLLTLSNSRNFVLALDNDDAGIAASEKIADYLDRYESKLKLLRLDIPKQFKDVGDWIAAEPKHDIYKDICEALPVSISGLMNARQIAVSVKDYVEKLRSSNLVQLKFSPALNECVRLLPGKLVGVCGSYGAGKSTLAEHFCMEALTQKFKVLVVSAEMSPAEFALKCLRMVRNEPLDDPKFLKTLSEKTIGEVSEQVELLMHLLNMTNGFGTLEVQKIETHIHTLKSLGIVPDIIVIDHLLAICNQTEANSIMEICKQLKLMARNHDVCVVLLSHVRKSQGNSKTIYRPQLDDIYGSSGLQIYADCIMAVASDKQKAETYVETVKVERLGGRYVDVSFSYADYCLSELEVVGKTFYNGNSKLEETEEVY